MNNTPNKFTTTANNVEATANFINKVAQSKINNTADKYDFSWHGVFLWIGTFCDYFYKVIDE